MEANVAGSFAYMSKNSCTVEKSKKTCLQEVGIWTVQKSSPLSSIDVPMKSNVKQFNAAGEKINIIRINNTYMRVYPNRMKVV